MDNKRSIGPGLITLYVLAFIAIVLIVYRYIAGLGGVTNLSDGSPWGFWIGIDIMAGIALTAGGLTIAAVVHIFGGEKYRSVLRPAILTALLGYVLEVGAVLLDLGRTIDVWHAVIYWNNESPMFLVTWCVLLYGTILAIEFAPTVMEEFSMSRLKKLYDKFSPWMAIVIVTFFIYLMSTPLWGGIAFVVFSILWLFFRFSLPKGSALIVLIITGVVLSVSHQSALGLLFVIVPQKLSSLWYTSLLPIDFLITAIAVGCAMVIFESSISSKVFGFGLEKDVIVGLGKALLWVLVIAIVFKAISMFVVNDFVYNATGSQTFFFLIEIIVGLILPIILLLMPAIKNSAKALFYPATMVIFGVMLNRANVSWIGMNAEGYPKYYPNIMEVLITLGIFAIGILMFYYICKWLPVFKKEAS